MTKIAENMSLMNLIEVDNYIDKKLMSSKEDKGTKGLAITNHFIPVAAIAAKQ